MVHQLAMHMKAKHAILLKWFWKNPGYLWTKGVWPEFRHFPPGNHHFLATLEQLDQLYSRGVWYQRLTIIWLCHIDLVWSRRILRRVFQAALASAVCFCHFVRYVFGIVFLLHGVYDLFLHGVYCLWSILMPVFYDFSWFKSHFWFVLAPWEQKVL